MALTWSPKQFELARAEELALSASLSSSRPWIVSGLALSAGTGLNVAISAGVAWIDGYVVSWDAATEEAVTGSATNHVWIELTRDGNDNVTAVAFVVNTTGVAPTGDNVKLGTATTDGSSVTGTATTGRSPQTQVLVSSVFGRDGAVVAASGDYDADEVDYDNATSGLAATDVQAAVDELAARPTSGGWTAVVGQFSSLEITNQTTPQDTDLTVALDANSEYFFELDLFYDYVGGGNNINSRITVPSGATGDYDRVALYYTSSTSTSSFNREAVKDRVFGTTYLISINILLGAGDTTHIVIKGSVTTGVTAGDLKWQFAQQTSNSTSPVRLRRGSSMKVKKVS